MPLWRNILIGTGVSAGVIGSVYAIRKLTSYSKDMNNMKDELQTIIKVNVHSIKLDGLTIRVDIKLQNPTNGTMKLKFPYINILYNEKMLGSSTVIDEDVVLPSFGEAEFNDIMVNVPVLGLISFGSAIVDLLIKKEEVPIVVQVITPIDLGWKKELNKKAFPINLKPLAYGG